MGILQQKSRHQHLLERFYSALPVWNRVVISLINQPTFNSSSNSSCYIFPSSLLLIKNIKMSVSKIRTNFHATSEDQINMELHASYVYMSMAAYFDRDDVALHGFAKRF